MTPQDLTTIASRNSRLASAARVIGLTGVCILTAASAIVTKEALTSNDLEPLARVAARPAPSEDISRIVATIGLPAPAEIAPEPSIVIHDPLVPAPAPEPAVVVEEVAPPSNLVDDTSIRFFNGRPVRPARTIRMSVTAYAPDENSCAGTADGITSSNHDVYTNAMKMVAADSRVLPLGSLVSVPGYDEGRVVPVLDRGGAIKGSKLDVLYPTHDIALRWGRRNLTVTVWEYADGLPPCDYRKVRDSKQ